MKPCKGVEKSPRGKGKGNCPTCGSEVAAHDLEGVLREELREEWSDAARAAAARKRHGIGLTSRDKKAYGMDQSYIHDVLLGKKSLGTVVAGHHFSNVEGPERGKHKAEAFGPGSSTSLGWHDTPEDAMDAIIAHHMGKKTKLARSLHGTSE